MKTEIKELRYLAHLHETHATAYVGKHRIAIVHNHTNGIVHTRYLTSGKGSELARAAYLAERAYAAQVKQCTR